MNHAKYKYGLLTVIQRAVLVLICFSGISAYATPLDEIGNLNPQGYPISVQVDSLTRWFKLIIPPRYDHTEPRPLLLCFHGGDLSMAFMVNNRKDLIKRCADENWILVFPNGYNGETNRASSTWNAMHCCGLSFTRNIDDIKFVTTMIDTLSAILMIDSTRIYAMGGSNGGMLTHRLAAEMPDVFAAAAVSAGSIGGQIGPLSPEVAVSPTAPIPIIMIHGMNDVNVNFTGDRSVGGIRFDISFMRSVALWVDNNQGPGSQSDTTLVNGNNGNVWIVTYNDNNPDMEVRAIAIQNKGHGWPSLHDFGFDGTNAMVDFLMRFSK